MQQAVPRQRGSLCRSGSTPAVVGTSGGRSARRTSWWWALQTCDLWTLPCPGDTIVTAGSQDSQGGKGRDVKKGEEGVVCMAATWCQYWSKGWRVLKKRRIWEGKLAAKTMSYITRPKSMAEYYSVQKEACSLKRHLRQRFLIYVSWSSIVGEVF